MPVRRVINGMKRVDPMKYMGLLLMILCAAFLNACSVKDIDMENNEDRYSRDFTESICTSGNFGGGNTDDIYVVLNYIYKSDELREKYGDAFEVEDVGGSAESQVFLFRWFFKGMGKYFVTIDGDDWTVEVYKSYFGKWTVTKCYPGWELT